MNILVFAGASEGRVLARRLARLPVTATFCVATEYGGELLGDLADGFSLHVGRMDADAMRSLMTESRCGCVVDATHPYAVRASAAIRAACESVPLPLLRLSRAPSGKGGFLYVENAAAAAAVLDDTEGNILLTTGTKDLAAFTGVAKYAERLFPRVLPTVESVAECVRLGFRRAHIIAMQGPFGRELNLAIMRQFAIAVLVTKDGGAAGGFPEKAFAAEEAGAEVVVIGRPPEIEGLDLEAVVAAIEKMLEAAE